jgi:hypothetical protein
MFCFFDSAATTMFAELYWAYKLSRMCADYKIITPSLTSLEGENSAIVKVVFI